MRLGFLVLSPHSSETNTNHNVCKSVQPRRYHFMVSEPQRPSDTTGAAPVTSHGLEVCFAYQEPSEKEPLPNTR